MTARPSESIQFAAAYRSATRLTTRGSATGDVTHQLAQLDVDVPGAFTYKAAVANRFPQQLAIGARALVSPRLTVMAQVDWWDWSAAFRDLSITLDEGSNAVINAVVGASTIRERVPLDWRDQVVRRAGAEYTLREGFVVRGGYASGGRVVPEATLTPMTAAIIEHAVGLGVGWQTATGTLDLGLQVSPSTRRQVSRSRLAGSGRVQRHADGSRHARARCQLVAAVLTWAFAER